MFFKLSAEEIPPYKYVETVVNPALEFVSIYLIRIKSNAP